MPNLFVPKPQSLCGSDSCSKVQGQTVHFSSVMMAFLWNNNNAGERLSSDFAYYREDTVGTMKEAGLSHYLAFTLEHLPHLSSTRGVSFLKFMLSRETDFGIVL